MSRRWWVTLAGCLLAVVGVTPPALSSETQSAAVYLELVERSCADDAAAILELSRWSRKALKEVAQELFKCDLCRQAWKARAPSMRPARLDLRCHCQSHPWARAVVVETFLALTSKPATGDLFRLAFAAGLLRKVDDDSFRRRWYLTAGLSCLLRVDLGCARNHLEKGLEQFEHDPALLVALGTTYEVEAWRQRLVVRALAADGPARGLERLRQRAEQRRRWSEAEDLYEQALAHDPGHPEARLRLGRVRLLLDRTDQGLGMLRWVTEHAKEPDLIYLAHLFIGRELKQSGDFDAAISSYRAALDADPLGQAAYVATSQALRMSGNPTAAAEVLERGLARSRMPVRDSWWRYPEGRLDQASGLLTQLHDEVCR